MYITATKAITAQPTFDNSFSSGNIVIHTGNKYLAHEPNYMGLIAPNLLRRMGKSIRMGIGAGFPLINEKPEIDAIIIGSAEGGLEDCFKFLNQIVVYEEGTLSPTNFVQSTPNALAGNLALMTRNTGYNITHVHKGNAFENALIDAKMLLNEGNIRAVLVGNVEEISEYNYNVETLAGQFKSEETTSDKLLQSNTPGTVCGEGSCMFVVQNTASNAIANILDVEQIAYATSEEIAEMIPSVLLRNNLTTDDIDGLIVGLNGDSRSDYWYEQVYNTLLPNAAVYSFKNLFGDCPSASAFAAYLAVGLINGEFKNVKPIRENQNKLNRVLIYNHYKGEQHGFIILEKTY